ncbi:FAD-dependent oxidoreductase [Nonomuraea sp. NPDC048916]|uniref:NAD(P)/FAD-dependent oxidoreductase n=1 Tax=Nonomuraea sp. NPDC048916 TaxID=3154232 RepID=UPI0033CEF2FB
MTSRIVVLGAGYAGLTAATRLAKRTRRTGAEIILVNAAADFLERPRLHQHATGQRLRALPLADVFDPKSLVVDRVTGLDLAERRVHLQERVLSYDLLLYALGSTVETESVPGAAEHAHTLADEATAARLAAVLDTLPAGAAVAVCGGGLCGIEMAAEAAESHPRLRITLISRSEPGSWLSSAARRHLRHAFDRLGVKVVAGAEIVEVAEDSLALASGARLSYDAVIWAGGFTVAPLARAAGLAVNTRGRIVVDESLRSISHPEVYAVGDAVAVSGPWGETLAYGCRSGGFTGPYAADAIVDGLAGREPRPFRFRYLHECVSLGRRDAVVQFLHADETPRRLVLTGKPAVRYKDTVLNGARLLFRWPGPYIPRLAS